MTRDSESVRSITWPRSVERRQSIHSNETSADDSPVPEEVIDKPILAINYRNKFLGGAHWKPDEGTLIILGDIHCTNVEDMLDLGDILDGKFNKKSKYKPHHP